MKNFFRLIAAVKAVASLAFTAGIMLLTVASMLFEKNTLSTSAIWQAMFLALIYGSLHYFAFSENVFLKLKTSGRIAILCASMFLILSLFAAVFHWFPIASITNWLIFAGIYSLVFLVATVALRIVFRVGELHYSDMLKAYQSKHRS